MLLGLGDDATRQNRHPTLRAPPRSSACQCTLKRIGGEVRLRYATRHSVENTITATQFAAEIKSPEYCVLAALTIERVRAKMERLQSNSLAQCCRNRA